MSLPKLVSQSKVYEVWLSENSKRELVWIATISLHKRYNDMKLPSRTILLLTSYVTFVAGVGHGNPFDLSETDNFIAREILALWLGNDKFLNDDDSLGYYCARAIWQPSGFGGGSLLDWVTGPGTCSVRCREPHCHCWLTKQYVG